MPTWFDRFGESWATQGLTDDPTVAQADAGWAYIGQAPPTVEQFNSINQWSDDKDNWLYGQVANVISSANMVPDPDDLTQLLRAIEGKLRILLLGPTTFYVDITNGNDTTGTGEQAKPFRTIQQAIIWIAQHIDQAYQTITIQLSPGTYDPFWISSGTTGAIILNGDNANPRSYLIKNINGGCINLAYGALLYVQGISLEATGQDTVDYDTWGVGLNVQQAAVIAFDSIAIGPCSWAGMRSGLSGILWPWQAAATKFTIYGGGKVFGIADWSSNLTIVRNTITIQNNPNYSSGFLYATMQGGVQAWNAVYSGTARGVRAVADVYGVININGASSTTIPGDQPAAVYRGGLII
jgi:hypothetical protein